MSGAGEAVYGLPVVDAHHHFWDLARGRYPWLQEDYDPKSFFLGDYAALRHDFLPDDYRATSRGCNVIATVHVEAERDRSEQVAETVWLHEMHARYGMPNAVVGHAWLDRPETEERLLEHLRYPLVRGIRSKPVTSRNPSESVRGKPGTMQDEKWLRGLALLGKHSLSWDLRVPAWHLPEAAEVAAMFPTLPIVLNHHGFAWDRSEEGLKRWCGWLETIARQPNVHVKVSEFGVRDRAWDWTEVTRIIRDTVAVFGWQRAMFASNFPVSSLRIDYPGLVTGVARALDVLTPAQQRAVMCDNALKFYRIEAA